MASTLRHLFQRIFDDARENTFSKGYVETDKYGDPEQDHLYGVSYHSILLRRGRPRIRPTILFRRDFSVALVVDRLRPVAERL